LAAVRRSHDRIAELTGGLGREQLDGPSACSQWSVAQVLSHLGSQAEIFSLFADAGLSRGEPPAQSVFGPIWDSWNARSPRIRRPTPSPPTRRWCRAWRPSTPRSSAPSS